jgi:hypothetical protein
MNNKSFESSVKKNKFVVWNLFMSKNITPIEIEKKQEDLVYYILNGIPVVRRKSGFSKDGLANNPNYKKVKENSTEFGHCSKTSKMIRLAINEFLGNCGDKLMYQKFTKVMTSIKNLDNSSQPGFRRVEIGLQHEDAFPLLRNFQFGEYHNLGKFAFLDYGLFGTTLSFQSFVGEAILVTIQPNFLDYTTKNIVNRYKISMKNSPIELQTQENQMVLFFLVLIKKGEITNVGFL